jgi:hypothetical protein
LEASGTGEHLIVDPEESSTNNQVVVVVENEQGDDNENGTTNLNTSGGRLSQVRGDPSQYKRKNDFGPWTEAVAETVQSMGAANQAIKDVQLKFTLNMADLILMEETRDKFRELEEMCRVKDEEIKRQENTITTLNGMHLKQKRNIEHQMEEIVREKQHLNQEKAKQEKRNMTAMAEERFKLRNEFD